MRDYIVPLIMGILLVVLGPIIAIQPIVDPGYLHPLGLALTGIGTGMFGAAFIAWAFMAHIIDKVSVQ